MKTRFEIKRAYLRRETAKYSTRAERAMDWVHTLGDRTKIHARRISRRLERDSTYRERYLWGRRLAPIIAGYRGAGLAGARFTETSGSADTSAVSDHRTLANRARQLERDDPLAQGLLDLIVRNVVGTGIRPQAAVSRIGLAGLVEDNEDANRLLEDAFWARAHDLDAVHRCSFEQWQALVLRTFLRDGDVFVVPVVYEPGAPVQFEIVEKDRVSSPVGAKPEDSEGRIVEGVEKDRQGRIVAYWIARNHPGDFILTKEGLPRAENFTRIPADRVLRMYEPGRAGASFGVSGFHAVLQDLRDLDLLMLASLKRVQVAACLAVFLESEVSPESFFDGLEGDENLPTSGAGQLQANLEPGLVTRLAPGEKVSTVSPNFPTPELYPFVKMIAMRIAAAFGIGWQEVLHNWSEDSYSSARTTVLESRKLYRWIQQLFARRILLGVWKTVLQDEMLRSPGRFDGVSTSDLAAVGWQYPGWEWVDPMREMRAEAIALSVGLTTWRASLAKRGVDWQDHFRQLARENEKISELGLDALLNRVYGRGRQDGTNDVADAEDSEDSWWAPHGLDDEED